MQYLIEPINTKELEGKPMPTVGRELRRLRRVNNNTLDDLSQALGMSRANIFKKEKACTYKDLQTVCEKMKWAEPETLLGLLGLPVTFKVTRLSDGYETIGTLSRFDERDILAEMPEGGVTLINLGSCEDSRVYK